MKVALRAVQAFGSKLDDVGQRKRFLCKIGSFSLRRRKARCERRTYAKATGGASLKLLGLIERKGLVAVL
jgi:hypothetical protein